jgi:hypothetical protein
MNTEIINDFVQFYIQTFNDKSRSGEFISVWKDYSIFVYNLNTYTKETLLDYIRTLYAYKIKVDQQNDVVVSITQNGDRRANILLSYQMYDESGNTVNVSQYILLAYSNNKEFWIHTSLLNTK